MPTRVKGVGAVRRLTLGAICLAPVVLLLAPSAALAEKSGYESVGVPGGPGGQSSSTLPFTGFDLAAAALVGLALLLIGLGLWRLGGHGSAGAEDAS